MVRLAALAIAAIVVSSGIAVGAPGAGAAHQSHAALESKVKSSPETDTFFEQNVRPVLAENCFQCHAQATGMSQGGLRLDSRGAVLTGGRRGPAISLSNPDQSLLLRAISYEDKSVRMPPKGRLSAEQIGALTAWVKTGARWPEKAAIISSAPGFDLQARKRQHWAWQKVVRPSIPAVKNAAWVRNPIDAFVLAGLESRGLRPAVAADRRTLLRRVTFDLIGLPPAPQDVEAFVADSSPDAYEKAVDRLLASPRYGERWGRHWLDLVRYAETCGHEWDIEKTNPWQYRDYVIRALNTDVPYNQFVMEHIAGDQMPHPRINPADRINESIIGTGFWWLGEAKHFPVELEQDEAERLDNQVDVFGKAFLGLSMGCARCHNHKFDAISTKDYYALCGYLKSSRYEQASIELPQTSAETIKQLAQVSSEINAALVAGVTKVQPKLSRLENALLLAAGSSDHTRLAADGANGAQAEAWAAYLRQTAARDTTNIFYPWAILANEKEPAAFIKTRDTLLKSVRDQQKRVQEQSAGSVVLADFTRDDYKSWFPAGEAFGAGPRTAYLQTESPQGPVLNAVMARAADSGAISDKLEGTLRSPTFSIPKNRIWFHIAGTAIKINVIIDGYQLVRDPVYGGLSTTFTTGKAPEWRSMDVRSWIGHKAYVEVFDSGSARAAVDKIVCADNEPPHDAINPLILKILEDPALDRPEMLAAKYQVLLADTLRIAGQNRKIEEQPDYADILNWILQNRDLLAAGSQSARTDDHGGIGALVEKKKSLESYLPSPRHAMALIDGSPEDDRVRIRGSHKTLGDTAPRRLLEALGGAEQTAPKQRSGRLELAERLADPANPLIARVLVNRVWLHHFGDGIVRTPDDFGVMGERPANPKLLDWLASVFVESSPTGGAGGGAPPKSPYACGWSLKKLHRLMVLSAAYQMASRPDDAKTEALDPQNKLLHRMQSRRLEAECIRDSILAVSGRLDTKMYGEPVTPFFNDFTPGRGRPGSGPLDGAGRRSIYLGVRRNFLIPMFTAFDFPVPFNTVGRRSVSNVPAQALALMNNPFVVEQAGLWSRKILSEPGRNSEQRINALYLSAYGRPPSSKETLAALAFLAEQDKSHGRENNPASWADLCHVLINVKEFIFVN